MAWTAENWVGVYILAFLVPLAAVVFFANPGRPTNRVLGALLLLEALAGGMGRLWTAFADPQVGFATLLMTYVVLHAVPLLYPVLLGLTLDTPLVRPFQYGTARRALVAAAILLPVWPVLAPYGMPETTLLGLLVLVFVFALVASADAFRRAPPGSSRRNEAKWFLLTYGCRDAILLPLLIYTIAFRPETPANQLDVQDIGLAVVMTVYAPLLTYAILRNQLFRLDLGIKWTLRRGTVAAFLLAVFLIVSQIVETWASQELGGRGWIVGAIAAGLLLFALSPLQRIADRIANAAMPHTAGTREYFSFKRLEIYRAALQSVIRDHRVDAHEHRLLQGLRKKLGVDDATARALEADILGELGGTAVAKTRSRRPKLENG